MNSATAMTPSTKTTTRSARLAKCRQYLMNPCQLRPLAQRGLTAVPHETGAGAEDGLEAATGPALASARPSASRIENVRDQREDCESMVCISCAGNPPTVNVEHARPADCSFTDQWGGGAYAPPPPGGGAVAIPGWLPPCAVPGW